MVLEQFLYHPFTPSGLVYLYTLDRSISNISVWLVFLLATCIIENSVFNANNVDPDQTSHVWSWVYTVCQFPF